MIMNTHHIYDRLGVSTYSEQFGMYDTKYYILCSYER